MKIYYKLKELFISKHFIIFVIIGIINTIIYNGLYILMLNKTHYLISSIIAYLISMTISFFLNCKYNYKVKPSLKKYIAFPISGIPTFFMQTVGLSLIVEIFLIPEKYAGLLSSIIAIPFSYIIMNIILKK